MIHPSTRIQSARPEVGDGVFATRAIPRGTIVWTQCRFDRVLSAAEVRGFDPAHRAVVERYAHLDADSNRILCWDAGRYVNHACEPTLRGLGPWLQVARRDIEAGEEITCDYAECNVDPALACECGDAACRGTIHGRDLLQFFEAWDDEARSLALAASARDQPLWPFLLDRREVAEWFNGTRDIPSFRALCAFTADGSP